MHVGNAVTCRHASTNKEEVLPVDRLVIFDNSNNDAVKVASLDDDEYLVKEVQGYKGYPIKRSDISFLILFEGDDLPIWVPYSRDLSINSLVQNYMQKTDALEHLLKDSKASDRYIKDMKNAKLKFKKDEELYIDIRIYSDAWYEGLQLPEAFIRRHVALGKVIQTSNDGTIAELHVPIFNEKIKFDALLIKWYGVKINEINDDMVIINEKYLQ